MHARVVAIVTTVFGLLLAFAPGAVGIGIPARFSRSCGVTLQTLIDAAPAGSTLNVPACVYRESVTIDKPLTLDGHGRAQIRGSDIWRNWTRSGARWIAGTLPSFWTAGECAEGEARCGWPEQVFIDGQPLTQVAAAPGAGQFAVTADRQVVLADDPAGRVVEVTTRVNWIDGRADDVVIRGFTMKHAATSAQWSPLYIGAHANWTIEDNVLSDVHGDVLNVSGARHLRVMGNDISRGGDLGIGGADASDVLIQGNHIHDNNTEGFSAGWEAGGIKLAHDSDVVIDTNEVDHNAGPGIWLDIDCARVTVSNNRVHDNSNAGIVYELSHDGAIVDNQVWENGWGYATWGWGAGILIQNSSDNQVADNTLAWNADGITVVSQDRGPQWNAVAHNDAHDNTLIGSGTLLGWFQDWDGVLYDAASGNGGAGNRYWRPDADGVSPAFEWADAGVATLAAFNATPGEERGRYLSDAECDEVLHAQQMPSEPEPR